MEMMRDYLLNKLREEYGEPTFNPSSQWWTVGHRRPFPVHICINWPSRGDEVHVLIYDPLQTEGPFLVEARAKSTSEVDQLYLRIPRIVHVNDISTSRV